jgi:hypothetical protein
LAGGPWRAPAGERVRGGVEGEMTRLGLPLPRRGERRR